VIYESTNYIENHIQDKPACLAWQGGTATQGIHNVLGSAAIAVPGRNSTAWTTNNDSYRWTPSGPVVNPVLTWYQVGVAAPIGTGPSITVTPPPTGANYTCRFVYPICNAGWASCNGNQGLGPDTVFVLPGPPNLPNPTINFTNPTCNYTCDGEINVTPIGISGTSTISWNIGTGYNLTNLCGGIYTYNIVDAIGCSVTGNITLITPPIVTTGPIIASDTVCFGSTSELYSVPTQTGYTYAWSSIGNIVTGQGNDSILIDWNSFSGFIPGGVQVMATNSVGCNSLPVTFDLMVLQIQPTIQPIGSLCEYDAIVDLVATPIGGIFSGDGVVGTQFDPSMAIGSDTISYIYSISGCTFDTSLITSVYPRPTVEILMDDNVSQYYEICEGDSALALYTTIENPIDYNVWYFMGDTLTQDNLGITWMEPGMYDISVVHWANGCVSYPDDQTITVEECPQTLIYIPNSFTPNGDEWNNTWQPVFTSGFDPFDFNLFVFNRWGEIIFESNNSTMGWDGTYKNQIVPEGIYIYRIQYGDPENGSSYILQGHVNMIN
jgi:gliding motility-associated-like protein